MSTQLSPYLHFTGNCETAMKFYQAVFGGDLQINRMSDYAPPDAPKPEGPEGVMHSTLDNGIISFMASDGMPEKGVAVGDNISISIAGEDEETLTGYFNGLAEGGEVTKPLSKEMWGDTFGMLKDQFGINWMVNITGQHPDEQAAA
jgi:PhnB protein